MDLIIDNQKPINSKIQTQLSKVYLILKKLYQLNQYFCQSNPLHLLAQLPNEQFDAERRDLTTYLLRKDSFLAPNIIQFDSKFMTPLSLAINGQNQEFIETFMKSDLIKINSNIHMLIDLTDLNFCKAIQKAFQPNMRNYLDTKRSQNPTNFRINFIKALLDYFLFQQSSKKAQITQNFAQILQKADNIVKEAFYESEDSPKKSASVKFFSSLYQSYKPKQLERVKKAYEGLTEADIKGLSYFMECSIVQYATLKYQQSTQSKDLSHILKPKLQIESIINSNKGISLDSHSLLQKMFSTFQLHDGLLLASIAKDTQLDDLKKLSKLSPSLCKFTLNQISANPVYDAVIFGHKSSKSSSLRFSFPFQLSYEDTEQYNRNNAKIVQKFYCYKYAFKFACFFQPQNRELLEFILCQMDFESQQIQPFLFEIVCLIGHFLGTDHSIFNQLFYKKPWLMGQNKIPLTELFDETKDYTPKYAQKFYASTCLDIQVEKKNLNAYNHMIKVFGQLLIESHKVEYFGQFIESVQTFVQNPKIYKCFVKTALRSFSVKCLPHIFAFCLNHDHFKSLKVKRLVHRTSCDDKLSVSHSDIQETKKLISAIQTENKGCNNDKQKNFNLLQYLNNVPIERADTCINLILDNRLLKQHFQSLFAGLKYNLDEVKKGIPISYRPSYFYFFREIYNIVSPEIAQKLVKLKTAEYQKNKNLVSGDKKREILLLTILLKLGQNSELQQSLVKNDQTGPSRFASKQKQNFLNQIKTGESGKLTSPQIQLLKEAQYNQTLNNDLAGRLGVTTNNFKEIMQESCKIWSQMQLIGQKSYPLVEILEAQNSKQNGDTKNKIGKISPSSNYRSVNELEEAVQWQKFKLIEPYIEQIMENLTEKEMISLFNQISTDFFDKKSCITLESDQSLSKLDTYLLEWQSNVEQQKDIPQMWTQTNIDSFNFNHRSFEWKNSWRVLLQQNLLIKIGCKAFGIISRQDLTLKEVNQVGQSQNNFALVVNFLNLLGFSAGLNGRRVMTYGRYNSGRAAISCYDSQLIDKRTNMKDMHDLRAIHDLKFRPFYIRQTQAMIDKIFNFYTSDHDQFARVLAFGWNRNQKRVLCQSKLIHGLLDQSLEHDQWIENSYSLDSDEEENLDAAQKELESQSQKDGVTSTSSPLAVFRKRPHYSLTCYLQNLGSFSAVFDKEQDLLGEIGLLLKKNVTVAYFDYFLQNYQQIRESFKRQCPWQDELKLVFQSLAVMTMINFKGPSEQIMPLLLEKEIFDQIPLPWLKAILSNPSVDHQCRLKVLESITLQNSEAQFETLWQFIIKQTQMVNIETFRVLKVKFEGHFNKANTLKTLLDHLNLKELKREQISEFISLCSEAIQPFCETLSQDPLVFVQQSAYRFLSKDITLVELINEHLVRSSNKKLSLFDFETTEEQQRGLIEQAWNEILEQAQIQDKLNFIAPKVKSMVPEDLWNKIGKSSIEPTFEEESKNKINAEEIPLQPIQDPRDFDSREKSQTYNWIDNCSEIEEQKSKSNDETYFANKCLLDLVRKKLQNAINRASFGCEFQVKFDNDEKISLDLASCFGINYQKKSDIIFKKQILPEIAEIVANNILEKIKPISKSFALNFRLLKAKQVNIVLNLSLQGQRTNTFNKNAILDNSQKIYELLSKTDCQITDIYNVYLNINESEGFKDLEINVDSSESIGFSLWLIRHLTQFLGTQKHSPGFESVKVQLSFEMKSLLNIIFAIFKHYSDFHMSQGKPYLTNFREFIQKYTNNSTCGFDKYQIAFQKIQSNLRTLQHETRNFTELYRQRNWYQTRKRQSIFDKYLKEKQDSISRICPDLKFQGVKFAKQVKIKRNSKDQGIFRGGLFRVHLLQTFMPLISEQDILEAIDEQLNVKNVQNGNSYTMEEFLYAKRMDLQFGEYQNMEIFQENFEREKHKLLKCDIQISKQINLIQK